MLFFLLCSFFIVSSDDMLKGVELVHKCACSSLETDGGGDVQGGIHRCIEGE